MTAESPPPRARRTASNSSNSFFASVSNASRVGPSLVRSRWISSRSANVGPTPSRDSAARMPAKPVRSGSGSFARAICSRSSFTASSTRLRC